MSLSPGAAVFRLAFAVKEVNPSETPTVGVTGTFSVDSISSRY